MKSIGKAKREKRDASERYDKKRKELEDNIKAARSQVANLESQLRIANSLLWGCEFKLREFLQL